MLRRANELEPHTGRELEEDEGEMTEPLRPPMTGAERTRRHRKRKKEQEEEVRDVTAAERMRNYRRRKKQNQRETEPNETPAALNLEPMPGGSRDPVRFFPRPDPNQLQLSPRGAVAPVDSVMPHAGGKPNCGKADEAFRKKFTENKLGAVCNICERIWFQDDLKFITTDGARVLLQPGHFESVAGFVGCQTCRNSLRDGRVPVLSVTNGFTYPELPSDLPPLDIITESEAAKYGDICAAKVVVMGTEILLVSVYISPGTTTTQKLWFLSRHLGPIAELDTPMVVTGDFNLDVSKQDSSRFVEFMANHFKLRLSNDVKKTTTLGVDAKTNKWREPHLKVDQDFNHCRCFADLITPYEVQRTSR
ncbi:hypothetical protein pipiens_011217 [Culex pipiens pipiens]|uniref:Endonuclease/exonuclease/phosphatase domain-containing protein n=1 Tax=Culex pipiens pipiens TaxID=38569 RepID=A0ABD1D772_CULPP